MCVDPTSQKFPDYAAQLIRRKAKQLVGRYGFKPCDQEDIEQDLSLDLWCRLERFDPNKGALEPFIDHVVKRKIASLIEYRRAAKRDYRRESISLNTPVQDSEGNTVEWGELLDEEIKKKKRRILVGLFILLLLGTIVSFPLAELFPPSPAAGSEAMVETLAHVATAARPTRPSAASRNWR